ncbi:AraC family transcriptional regulator [Polaribacter litorisediminis]|uniref:helix-turn-helix domain-containing protein n=1 Tax=Polaribacter litorisediminis TaxID=1908341 RepID=UPI001CBF0D00|nr:AraC family transcriptional regulator [Polaribacter litorisediminis]UAM96858.1 AraC family transcriptional regulator [Polaribacter litorisediminis]
MLSVEEKRDSDHVKVMAKYFNAKLDEGNNASTISMDNTIANGFISSYRLFNGLTVWVYNITFREDFDVELQFSEDRPYYFSYNVKGYFLHKFGEEEKYAKILQNQNMVVRGSSKSSVRIVFPAKVKLELAIIIIDTKLLVHQKIRNAQRIYTNIQDIFKNIPANIHYRHLGNIDPETNVYASIVTKNKETDLVAGLLTEGAVINMLASQINAYKKETSGKNKIPKLSKIELSKISTIGDYIINHIEEKISIQELSSIFLLSPKKLQAGVKHLYGVTIGNYILNLKMGHAKHLYISTDYNTSEICSQIGISSKSYFSKVFKDRYGISPSLFRKNLIG